MGKQPEDSLPSRPREFDWLALREVVRRRARSHLRHVSREDLEEVCQNAMVRFLRAARSEPVTNPEGLASVAASRAARDWLRAHQRWALRFEPLDPSRDPPGSEPLPSWAFGDPLERVRFVVYEFFYLQHPDCAELAVPYFESRSWAEVAAATGRSHGAVRKQWSRCMALLRGSLRQELTPLFEALRESGA